MILTRWNRYRDQGLLVLRLGIGIMFLFHGFPKLFGGPDAWQSYGSAMENLGITIFPAMWGFMAGFTEFFGALLLISGLFTRPVCILLAWVMFVAAVKHFAGGDGILGASHAIEDGIIFISMIFTGPGRWSVDEWWYSIHKRK